MLSVRIIGSGPIKDDVAYLGTLGGLMGAVFTAAGLVVALAALVTLLSIDRAIEQGIQAYLPRIQEQADNQIRAYLLLEKARSTARWDEAETSMKNALRLYDRLPDAKISFGISLAQRLIDSYYWEHFPTGDIETARAHAETRAHVAPPDRAIKWLEDAIESGQDRDGKGRAIMALLLAIAQQPARMVSYLEDAIPMPQGDRQLIYAAHDEWLRKPLCQAILVQGTGGAANWIRTLRAMFGEDFVLSSQQVRSALERNDLSPHSSHGMQLVVIGRKERWTQIDRFPTTITLWRLRKEGEELYGAIVIDEWFPHAPGDDDIFRRADVLKNHKPIDETFRILDEYFYVVGEERFFAHEYPRRVRPVQLGGGGPTVVEELFQ